MALYLGNNKVKINLDGIAYSSNLLAATSVINDGMLLSSDNYVFKDLNGLYLTSKESE